MGHAYTPTKTKNAEALIRNHWDGPLYPAGVLLALDVAFDIDGIAVTITPIDVEKSKLRGDLDNYLKLLGDGLNGVAYEDDSQISRILAVKV